ncbi:MAG: oligoendopeptidase F [Anaerovoracaceae bacterium]|nr:oligoendopeptidase F [Bacillota bacterium]MDY2671484.1 oligoendopeptidase F [Anaerovoracaceae bacterium]
MGEIKKVRTRDQIDDRYKWNIADMYPDEDLWEKDFSEAEKEAEEFAEKYSGRMGENGKLFYRILQERDAIWQKAEKVYVYAQMKSDEDNRVARYQELSQRAQSLLSKISASMSFMLPEIMEQPEGTLVRFLRECEDLKMYDYEILEIMRRKKHVLSKEAENIMAKFGEVTGAPKQIFSMINDADMDFGTVKDEHGNDVKLTHGNYISMMESKDRNVRKGAYEALYRAFTAQKNTLAATYYYNVKKDSVIAGLRHYDSSLLAELDGDDIPEAVYRNLIKVINEHLGALHKYVKLRKKILGLDEIHMYDIYAPLIEMPDRKVPYEEALDTVRGALAPLGQQYIEDLNKGLEAGWVDVYENEGKTSGAYSFGSYDSMPYVLMNYNDKFKDAFTIIHELGHSMNSYYTRRKQPYVYGGHSIFTAEVASTVNECLLVQYLLGNCKDRKEEIYLLNIYIEEFRATVFRQTMFAEFELEAHEAVERGEVLTADKLCKIYGDLNKKYFGEDVVYDDNIAMEWARIPHFYNSFYVYKYATGYSAAVAISNKILNEGAAARDAYLEFLAAGDSDYPIELLKGAGADMSTTEVTESACRTFEALIDRLEELTDAD